MFNIYDEVKGLKSIAITGHERPDGDCIGSCLALYLYLKKRMPEADVKVFLQKPSSAFNSIPAVGDIDSSFKSDIIFDAFIVLDSVPDRTGTIEMYSKAGKTINIDHHKSNAEGSSMVNYVVAGASSTAELIYDIIDKEFIDKDIATLIYMGIAHDTGVFRYSSTTPKTLKTVASLVEYGFDFSDLLDNTFFEKTYKQNRFQSRIVLDSKLYFDGKVIVGLADKGLMEEFGATKEDFEGCVELLRITREAKVAVLIYYKNEETSKISFRSTSDDYDVSLISQHFGGGGHVRAAGCDVKASVLDAEKLAIDELAKIMK